MSKKPGNSTARVSISLSQKVFQWAEELKAAKGYDNFSAYIAELIRRDKERDEKKQSTPISAAGKRLELNEPETEYRANPVERKTP